MKIKKERLEQGKRLLSLLGAILFLLLAIVIVSSYFMDEAEKESLYDEHLEIEDDVNYHQMIDNK